MQPTQGLFLNIRLEQSLLFLLFLFTTVQAIAQSMQTNADMYHRNWQQASEGVVFARHADKKTTYASAGLNGNGREKPDKDTIYEIGSITKVFTAILLAEAVREKLANFDDPVSTHLTALEFKRNSPFHAITLTELATHTSGLPRLPIDLYDGSDDNNPYAHYDEKHLVNSLLSLRKKHLDESGKYSYSNYGMGILGYVLENIYGQTYRDLLHNKILLPLNMTSTDAPHRFAELPATTFERLATPHSGGDPVTHWELATMGSAGAMISTAQDLIRFGTAHWDPETPAGLANSLREVAKPRMDHQGLGWGIDDNELSHSGRTGGFAARLVVNPADQTVRVRLANTSSISNRFSTTGDFLPIEGYWSGTLKRDDETLRLVTYIDKSGHIVVHSIDQGNQAVLSAKTEFVDDQFFFSFPSIPATYVGRLKNNQLEGTLHQQGRADISLSMKRSASRPDILQERLNKSMQGNLSSLNGYWSGYLNGKQGLFLYLKVTNMDENLSILELFSPDQTTESIPISSASLRGNKLKLFSEPINGTYSGKITKDKKSIKGWWKQGLLPTRLTLHFSNEKPERE